MKHFSTLFLSSAVLLASLAPMSPILAQEASPPSSSEVQISQPTELVTPHQPITTQQNGQTLSIFYQRSEQQKQHKIQYAVWSNQDGQDDLKWYVAGDQQTDIPLNQHTGSGTYTIHAYIVIQDKLTFLSQANFTVSIPKPIVTSSISEAGFLDIHIQHIPAKVTQVRVPIWSEKNGQDDIVWYTATPHTDGSYRLRVPLYQHKSDTGTYHIHLYTQEGNSNNAIPVLSSQFQVENKHIPSSQPPLVSIQNLNTSKGTYQVLIKPQPYTQKIKEINVATWSTSNQGNLNWRKASLQNSNYFVNISFQEHQSHNGNYHNHVYITYEDGSKAGYKAETVDLTKARLPVTFQSTLSSPGYLTANFGNIYDKAEVLFAVWSDENGQDDLKWYTASESGNRAYSGLISLQNHQGVGKYHVHVYQGKTGLGAFTMQVTAEQKKPNINTYPVGQCTWGAKEKAPWVQNYWGNANQWLTSARNAGFKTGSSPRIGAVAVWTAGQYGHVAVVTAVNGHLIQVEESNYAGNMRVGNYRGWFNPATDGVTGYIYSH